MALIIAAFFFLLFLNKDKMFAFIVDGVFLVLGGHCHFRRGWKGLWTCGSTEKEVWWLREGKLCFRWIGLNFVIISYHAQSMLVLKNFFFLQDMISKEVRIRELTLHAEKLKVERYTEYEMIHEMIEVRIAHFQAWIKADRYWTRCSKMTRYFCQ